MAVAGLIGWCATLATVLVAVRWTLSAERDRAHARGDAERDAQIDALAKRCDALERKTREHDSQIAAAGRARRA